MEGQEHLMRWFLVTLCKSNWQIEIISMSGHVFVFDLTFSRPRLHQTPHQIIPFKQINLIHTLYIVFTFFLGKCHLNCYLLTPSRVVMIESFPVTLWLMKERFDFFGAYLENQELVDIHCLFDSIYLIQWPLIIMNA